MSPTHSKEPSVACVPSCLVFRTFCLIVKQGKWFMIDFNTFQDKNSPNLKKNKFFSRLQHKGLRTLFSDKINTLEKCT